MLCVIQQFTMQYTRACADVMYLIPCRSQSDSLESSPKQCRMFLVRGQSRSETQLVEITPDNDTCPMTTCLRSRGCYVFYHRPGGRVYEWHGCKATLALKRCAHYAAKLLKRRWATSLLLTTQQKLVSKCYQFWSLTIILSLNYIVLKYCCHGINVVHTCCSLSATD